MGGTAASFGYWVRRRRLALDLTRESLARRVGCSPSALKKIERDERRPSRTMADRLADALGLPADQRDRFVAAALGEASAGRLAMATRRELEPAPAWLARTPAADQRRAVGRESELAWLWSHLSEAVSGGGRVVFVVGEAGMGKTALLTAFAEQASREVPDLVVARGVGTAVGALGDPYFPVRDAFRMLLADRDAPLQADEITRKQAERLWDFSATAAGVIVESGPRLLDVLVSVDTVSERLGMNVAVPTIADPVRTDVSDDVTKVLRAVASRRPLLLVLDDMQWSDTATAELVFHLVRALAGARVLVVCAYRGSEVAGAAVSAAGMLRKAELEARRDVGDASLDLGAIGTEAERALCDALLDLEAPDLDQKAHDLLFGRTRGHPLALLELVRELKTRGDLVRVGEASWVLHPDVNWDHVPARVAAVIELRLDRLDVDERALLTAAAVEGEYFTAEVAARVAELDVSEARRLLAERLGRIHGLVREESVERSHGRAVTRYRFGHALFQSFVHERLTPGARASAHGLVGAELEALHSGDVGPVVPLLAHHFTEAGDVDRAVPYLIRTGDHARLLQAYEEALAAYERAVELLRGQGDTERLARALMRIGLTHETAFEHESAQRAYDQAFALWPAGARSRGATGTATLRLVTVDPQSLNPLDDLGVAQASAVLFSGLVQYDDGANVVPDVAERWEISADGRRYTFHLRDDVSWSDGEPVTAHDFVASYQRTLDPGTGTHAAAALLLPVAGARDAREARIPVDQAGIHAVDDRTLVIELAEPTSYFMYNLASRMLVPVPRHVLDANGRDWCRPDVIVSNGPFQLGAWEPGRQSMVFERNPGYHGPVSGNVQRLSVQVTEPGDADHEQLYQADEVDVVANSFGTPFGVIDRLRDQFPHEYVKRGEGFITYYYWVDHESPPLDDRTLRQAMALAVDREAMARAWGVPAYGGFVPPGLPGHVPGIAAARDPDRAARLIADVVGENPSPMLVIGFDAIESVSQQLVDDWRAVGLPVELQLCADVGDQTQAWSRTTGPKVGLRGWVADYPDPDTFLRVAVNGLVPRWGPDGYSALLERAARTRDLAGRLELGRAAEQILAEEAVLVPLLYLPEHLLLKPWVTRFPTIPFHYPGHLKDVVIGPHPR